MDNTIQASSGSISVTGFPDRAVKTSATYIDMGTGSHLVSGILAALIQRGRTGRGQHVEVAMLDVAIPALTSAVAPALQGMKFKRLGNRHWGACPTNIYPARDGEILIFCLTEPHWRTLAKLMGREELIADPRCANHGARLKIADELDAIVSEWTRNQARDAMIEGLIEAEIPCAPVRTVEEVVADPEAAAPDADRKRISDARANPRHRHSNQTLGCARGRQADATAARAGRAYRRSAGVDRDWRGRTRTPGATESSERTLDARKGSLIVCETHRGFHTPLGRGNPCTRCPERNTGFAL